MEIDNLKTDPTKETGAWVPLDESGAAIKVAYTGGQDYKRKFQKRLRPYVHLAAGVGMEAVPPKEQELLALSALAEDVLLDWRGITENNRPLEYSKENARRLLESAPAFRIIVENAAANLANFRLQQQTTDAKNFETASAGA